MEEKKDIVMEKLKELEELFIVASKASRAVQNVEAMCNLPIVDETKVDIIDKVKAELNKSLKEYIEKQGI